MIDEIIERLKKKAWGISAVMNYRYDRGRIDAFYEAVKIVEEVVKEQNDGWIKCSDNKFPKFNRNVLVTLDSGEITNSKFYGFGEECQGYKEFPDGVWDVNQYGHEVIAWQPLPEPYKEV